MSDEEETLDRQEEETAAPEQTPSPPEDPEEETSDRLDQIDDANSLEAEEASPGLSDGEEAAEQPAETFSIKSFLQQAAITALVFLELILLIAALTEFNDPLVRNCSLAGMAAIWILIRALGAFFERS